MAELIATVEATAPANSFSIANALNAFQDGIVFQITGFRYNILKFSDNTSSKPFPVFTTNLSGDTCLAIIPLMRNRANADGEIVEPDGTFNLEVKNIILDNKGLSNDKLLPLLVDKLKNRDLIVRNKRFSAKSKDGTTYATAMINIDFKL